MPIPKAVKEAEERANALIMEQAKQREGTPEMPVPAPEQTPEVEEPVASPEEGMPETEAGVSAEAGQAPSGEKPQVPPPAETSPPPQEDYETKYKVLKGKYDKEVPELAGQVAFLVKKVAALEEALAEKERTGEEPQEKTEPAPPPEEPAKDLTEDPKVKYFQTEYPDIYEGTDIVARARAKEEFAKIEPRVREIARSMFKEEIDKLDKRLNVLEGHTVQATRQSFYDALYKAYPDWEAIQASPEFGEFIQGEDELSGIPRWKLLKDAYEKLDAKRAIRFFDLFTGKTSEAEQTVEEKPAAAPASTKPRMTISSKKAEAMVAPPSGKSYGSVETKEQARKVTPEEIKQFYRDVVNGKWKGREAEMRKEELRLINGIRGI